MSYCRMTFLPLIACAVPYKPNRVFMRDRGCIASEEAMGASAPILPTAMHPQPLAGAPAKGWGILTFPRKPRQLRRLSAFPWILGRDIFFLPADL